MIDSTTESVFHTGERLLLPIENHTEIPDVPKIPLRNYLLELTDYLDAKESSVYLIGVEPFIQEVWQEITKSHRRTLHFDKLIREKLGIHPMGFYAYKNGKKAVSITMVYALLDAWQEYCKKTDGELAKKWDEIYRSNFYLTSRHRLPIILPKYISPRLSYLAGLIAGDGNLANYHSHYMLKLSEKSTDQLIYVLKPLYRELFGVEPPLYQIYEGGYALQFNSKPLFRFLTKVLKLHVGLIPEFVYTLDSVNRAHFLAGVFDAEGFVSRSRNVLAISQAKKEFLMSLQNLFASLDIKLNGPITHTTRLGTWYTIRLEKKSEILKFAEYVGSYHINKSQRLKQMITKIKSR